MIKNKCVMCNKKNMAYNFGYFCKKCYYKKEKTYERKRKKMGR